MLSRMSPRPTRAMSAAERERAVETLAASFDDDPLFRWLLRDDTTRRAWIRWFHGVSFDHCQSKGATFTVAEGPSQGAILALLPGAHGPTLFDWIRALVSPPRSLPTFRLATTGLRVQAALDAEHPREPVVYVHVLGVHPSQKGRGLGGVLLREALSLAAQRSVPLYLETSNPVNLGFYQRFGLRVLRELRIGDAPPVWTLQTDGPPPLDG